MTKTSNIRPRFLGFNGCDKTSSSYFNLLTVISKVLNEMSIPLVLSYHNCFLVCLYSCLVFRVLRLVYLFSWLKTVSSFPWRYLVFIRKSVYHDFVDLSRYVFFIYLCVWNLESVFNRVLSNVWFYLLFVFLRYFQNHLLHPIWDSLEPLPFLQNIYFGFFIKCFIN